ncbi:phage GP46 family protein [Oleidesulfovibrio alaskensis]|jgi:phage gp46-like protein|uniref:phage GP46 family protein n=1 Tax=Oleidesulfovibrio alaskensis TaxID=58180 RepID=UPI0004209007|nr:phage GP46 family protein [Oleidesulfovibrio alaskensis]
MGNDAGLNPYTGDYTGERISHLGNAIYLRIMTPLGTWWADPTVGSRLHEIAREKDLPRIRTLAQQYAQQALAPLVEAGRAQSIQVTAMQPHNGVCLLIICATDSTGNQQTFQYPVRVI